MPIFLYMQHLHRVTSSFSSLGSPGDQSSLFTFAMFMISIADTDLSLTPPYSHETSLGQLVSCLRRPGSVGDFSGTLLAPQRENSSEVSFVTGSRHTTLNARSLMHRKFKLPLDHLRLADAEALAEIWCIVCRAADVTGVGLSEPDSPMQTRARTVIFYDTNKFDLYRNNFVLRKRIFLASDHSAHQALVFKFRHPDRRTTESVDPSPAAEIPYAVRFKEQLLPSLHDNRGIRRIFWHGCKIVGPCELDNVPYARLAEIFPALGHRGIKPDPDARLKAVNDLIIDERLLEIGTLNFAGGVSAKALISLWRVESGQGVLTGELSFQIKYDPGRISVGPITNLSESFYLELQSRLSGWTAAGSTKVHQLYRLGQAAEPTRAEARSMMLV
jgi:hypothetical protein